MGIISYQQEYCITILLTSTGAHAVKAACTSTGSKQVLEVMLIL